MFLPYGTALDWTKQGNKVVEITNILINNHLLPLLTYPDEKSKNHTNTLAYMDPTLKNFAPLSIGNRFELYYFDFFIPRIRDDDGKLKKYPGFQLDLVEDKEIEYRFFTKPGIIHNYFRRNYHYFFSDGVVTTERFYAWLTFVQISQQLLTPFIEEYFPGKSVESLVKTDFSEFIPIFVQ